MRNRFFIVFIGFLLGLTASVTAYGQADTLETLMSRELVVGVHPHPPYIIQGQNDSWDGLSIRLWRGVADRLDVTYHFVDISPGAENALLRQGEADVVLLGHVTAAADAQIEFSHIYHTAQMGIASSQTKNLSAIAKSFFSKRFWSIAAMLSVLLLIVGTIIYFVERRQNEDNFGGERSVAKGIGSGFWWAGVTMTTIGYGDKSPVTFWGRAIALIWMLVAMAITAVLTASLVSTVMGSAGGKKMSIPQDLRSLDVAAVEGTPAAQYLQEERVAFKPYTELTPALDAVNKQELDAVVHSVPELRYTINNDPSLALQVQPVQIDPTYYAFALAPGSPLRKPLNQALLHIIKDPLWQQELGRFIPEK